MRDCTQYLGSLSYLLNIINMSHRQFLVLGITGILLLSTIGQAHANPDRDRTEVRAGKVRIILDGEHNTQIQTDRIKVQNESLNVRRNNRYRHSTRDRRSIRSSVDTHPRYSDSCIDRENNVQGTNSSSSNTQLNRIRGNNRTVIQSSTDR